MAYNTHRKSNMLRFIEQAGTIKDEYTRSRVYSRSVVDLVYRAVNKDEPIKPNYYTGIGKDTRLVRRTYEIERLLNYLHLDYVITNDGPKKGLIHETITILNKFV